MPGRPNEINKIAWSIVKNSKQVDDCLGVYQAIAKNATKLNANKHNHFWGVVQRASFEQSVSALSRIYDSSRAAKIHNSYTIYNLLRLFEKRIPTVKPCHFSYHNVDELGVSRTLVQSALSGEISERRKALKKIHHILDEKLKNEEIISELKKITDYRDKFVAHQDSLSLRQARAYSKLPEFKQIYQLSAFAKNAAILINGMCYKVGMSVTPISGRMATLNAIKKFLDLEFDIKTQEGYAEHESFFRW